MEVTCFPETSVDCVTMSENLRSDIASLFTLRYMRIDAGRKCSPHRVNCSSNRDSQQQKIALFWGDHYRTPSPTSCSGLFSNLASVLYPNDVMWFVSGLYFQVERPDQELPSQVIMCNIQSCVIYWLLGRLRLVRKVATTNPAWGFWTGPMFFRVVFMLWSPN